MELTWPIRFRIAAVFAAGILLIGLLNWPLLDIPTPFDPVSLAAGTLGFPAISALIALAFLSGFIAYFISWPYGIQIAPLAVPAGLAVWALRTGSLSRFLQQNTHTQQLTDIYGYLEWEPFFWLAVIAVGFAGLGTAYRLAPPYKNPVRTGKRPQSARNTYLFAAVALFASVLIAQFSITILARGVYFSDPRIGSVLSQPSVGQIALAVTVSFGLAAFLIKRFLDVGYVWTIISTPLVTFVAINLYAKKEVLAHLSGYWPPVCFSNAAVAILPVQIVAFGSLGSIAGYWLAIKYGSKQKQQ